VQKRDQEHQRAVDAARAANPLPENYAQLSPADKIAVGLTRNPPRMGVGAVAS
jgi:hypothetical protein